jgi:hypothetical protein
MEEKTLLLEIAEEESLFSRRGKKMFVAHLHIHNTHNIHNTHALCTSKHFVLSSLDPSNQHALVAPVVGFRSYEESGLTD